MEDRRADLLEDVLVEPGRSLGCGPASKPEGAPLEEQRGRRLLDDSGVLVGLLRDVPVGLLKDDAPDVAPSGAGPSGGRKTP